jgi:hypothetical protein
MVRVARSLFEAATARGRLIRHGDIACIVMDGAGAVVVSTQELIPAQKWAQSRPPSSNLLSDRARFLDRFQTLISRPGSVQSTRGSQRPLERLAQAMSAAGYDLGEWVLPAEVREPGKPRPNAEAPTPEPTESPDPDVAPDTVGPRSK